MRRSQPDAWPARLARLAAPLAIASAALPAASLGAQGTRTLTACTPDALAICAELRLTSSPGLFEIALRTHGSLGQPASPVSVYNLVFATGSPTALLPVSTAVPPMAEGGAIVVDASPWDVFDTGSELFLSALTNRGAGGCVAGADVGGFGQAVRTCGAGEFATFAFTPTMLLDPGRFQILNLEAVALTDPVQAATCGSAAAPCRIVADTATVPEPASVTLVAGGIALIAGVAARRRRS
jgi:hypothetical protein